MCLIKSNVLPAITKVSAAGMCSLTLEYFFCGFHLDPAGICRGPCWLPLHHNILPLTDSPTISAARLFRVTSKKRAHKTHDRIRISVKLGSVRGEWAGYYDSKVFFCLSLVSPQLGPFFFFFWISWSLRWSSRWICEDSAHTRYCIWKQEAMHGQTKPFGNIVIRHDLMEKKNCNNLAGNLQSKKETWSPSL